MRGEGALLLERSSVLGLLLLVVWGSDELGAGCGARKRAGRHAV